MSVLLPNNAVISSIATASTSLGPHTYKINVFKDTDLHHSLESVATFTNDLDGSVTFTKDGATIRNSSGEIINYSPKSLDARIWTFDRAAPVVGSAATATSFSPLPLSSPPPHNFSTFARMGTGCQNFWTDRQDPASVTSHSSVLGSVAAVVRHDLHADFVAYAHGSLGSPPNATLSRALKAGYLRSYPHLTYDMWQKNQPQAVATAKGHLDKNRRNQRSTKIKPLPPTTESPEDLLPFDGFDSAAAAIFVAPMKEHETNYTDLMGKFPVESFLRNNYVMLSFYCGHVHTEPMPDRSTASLVAAYTRTFAYYRRFGQVPAFQRMDNETSADLNTFLRDVAKVTIEFVPPNNKRTNTAERIIRSWRNHFISGLHTVDSRFPMQCWDELLAQVDFTYSLLHPWTPNPTISAYEGFHGRTYDFAAHPIAPIGTHVVVYESPEQRATWAAHGVDGFYLGPALDHYRCYRVYVHATKNNRISDTLAWFPAAVHMPGSSSQDLIHAALRDLIDGLKSFLQCPLTASSGQPLALNETISAGLREATNLFADTRLPARIASAPPVPQNVDVITPPVLPPPASPVERVSSPDPAAATVPLQRVQTPSSDAPFPPPPLPRSSRSKHAAASKFAPAKPQDVPARSVHFFDHIGRRWRDTVTGERFSILSVDLPKQQYGKGSSTCHFRFYDYDKYVVPPSADLLEHTPCSEILLKRSPYVEFLDAPPAAVAAAAVPVFCATTTACQSPPIDTFCKTHMYTFLNPKNHLCHGGDSERNLAEIKNETFSHSDNSSALCISSTNVLDDANFHMQQKLSDFDASSSLGTQFMMNALSLPDPKPAAFHRHYFRWQNGKCIPLHPLSRAHANAVQTTLNLNADGTPLNYRGTFRGPNSSEWRRMDGAEISRLIDSGTISAIHRSACPADRVKDVTYYNPKPKEKYNAETDEITRRIRGTIGGDKVNYPGLVSSATADLFTVKALLHTVVSDRYTSKTDTRFATLDIVDFFIGTTLERSEYVTIPIKFIPQAIIDQYGLCLFIHNNAILFRVDKCMYGLPQAAYLSNKHLVAHLATQGYLQDPNVPCLFSHTSNGIKFTLIVDDFGVKYKSILDLNHLIAAIHSGGWKCKVDLDGAKYVGVSCSWDYVNNTLDTTMPHCVSKGLARFAPGITLKGAPSPAVYVPPKFGEKVQYETVDNSPPATAAETLWVQQVNGYFLYYARVQNSLILPACNDISATQAKPTARTVAATWRLLNYLASHPDHTVRYTGCDMILKVQSDASYQSRPGSISIAGGWHYCGNSSDDILNGTLHSISCRIPTVCGAVSEAEYAALYINGTAAAWERTVLAGLGYPQPPTIIITDNECAEGIANNRLTAKKSKAIAMRYHWIRDRIRLGEFLVKWLPGKLNYADFFTKHLPVYQFEQYDSIY